MHPLTGSEDAEPAARTPAALGDRLTELASSGTFFGTTDLGAAMARAGDVAKQSHHCRKELHIYTSKTGDSHLFSVRS